MESVQEISPATAFVILFADLKKRLKIFQILSVTFHYQKDNDLNVILGLTQ